MFASCAFREQRSVLALRLAHDKCQSEQVIQQPIQKLSKQRPLGNIFNFYVLLSVLLQFTIHIASFFYITQLCEKLEPRLEKVDLEKEFQPSLLNSAVYLVSLTQQVSTFAINFIGRPFREGITENPALYYGLLGVAGEPVSHWIVGCVFMRCREQLSLSTAQLVS